MEKASFNISDENISQVVQTALRKKLISEENFNSIFFNLHHFSLNLKKLLTAFPESTLNTVAIKANPVINILKYAAKYGLGAECASIGELMISQKAGFSSDKIVFDSPAKTIKDIDFALRKGIYLNIDNEQEFERVLFSLKNHSFKRLIGIRINPELSINDFNQSFSDEQKHTITGLKTSKFGWPISQAEEYFLNNDLREYLSGLHVHIGSQSCPIKMLIMGIKKVVMLAELLNNNGYNIKYIDIGGGLPVKYKETDIDINFNQFTQELFFKIPSLKKYKIITEFGRALFAKSGWVISKVEYTKWIKDDDNNDLKIAIIQVGADLFVRTAYMDWYHEIMVLNKDGAIKKGDLLPQSIAGPLCFSGDFLAKKRMLPSIEPGDWVIIKDTGAYTFSMWSLYNSRLFPPVYGYDNDFNIYVLKKGEKVNDIVSFWGT